METYATSSSVPAPPLVVVGVADTDDSDRAVRWGAEHARRTGGELRLVHAFAWPLLNVDVEPVPGIAGTGLRAGAEMLVEHARDIAHAIAPGVSVRTDIVDGSCTDVLIDLSGEADVLAVGSRGLGRMLSMMLGSTSRALARRAGCPVVVVRGEELTDGPIGVAYEGSELGEQALARAGRLAALYDAEVHLVIGVATPQADHGRILRSARAVIETAAPGVEVELSRIVSARDARELIAASEDVRMIVVPAASETAVSASTRTGAVVQHAHTPIWVERSLRQE